MPTRLSTQVLEHWPEHLDFAAFVESADGTPGEPLLYQGSLNPLFTSGAFNGFFENLRVGTGKTFGAKELRLSGADLTTAREIARGLRNSIDRGPWKFSLTYRIYKGASHTPSDQTFHFKKHELLALADSLLQLLETAQAIQGTAVFSPP